MSDIKRGESVFLRKIETKLAFDFFLRPSAAILRYCLFSYSNILHIFQIIFNRLQDIKILALSGLSGKGFKLGFHLRV